MGKTKTRADGERSDAGLHRTSMIWLRPDDEIVIIGLDTDDGPEHFLYDPRIHDPLDEHEIASIDYHGVLEPVLVLRDGKRFLVVAGRGRVRKAREAKKRQIARGDKPIEVPCILQKGDDKDLWLRSRAENSGRHDDGPLRQAADAAKAIQKYGMTEAEYGASIGKSQSTISGYIALLDMSAKVRAAVERGKITPTAAVKLRKLSKEEQDEQLDKLVASGIKPTAERARNAVRAAKGEAPIIPPRDRVARAVAVLVKLAPAIEGSDHESLLDVIDDLSRALTDGPLSALSRTTP